MKACSFLPAATNMIYQMGLEEFLEGVTCECSSDKPKVIRSRLENNDSKSREIDQVVSGSNKKGESLYYIDEDLLQQIEPDIIFTQDVCTVCQVGTSYVERAIHKLKKKPVLVPLTPKTLNDIYSNVITIAETFDRKEAAYRLLSKLQKRIDKITNTLQKNNARKRSVSFIEWLDPIYVSGHWIPDQLTLAGGIDMLSNPAGPSGVISLEKILRYDPEVIVIAPCGFTVERSVKEANRLLYHERWKELSAVKNNEVYLVDSAYFTCPSTQLVDGIELLANLLHPKLFPIQKSHRQKYASLPA